METIEERAVQASDGYDDQAYSAGLYMGYKEGAEEQRKLDIHYACECFCKTCMGQCKDTSHCDTLQKFRNELNAMEE